MGLPSYAAKSPLEVPRTAPKVPEKSLGTLCLNTALVGTAAHDRRRAHTRNGPQTGHLTQIG